MGMCHEGPKNSFYGIETRRESFRLYSEVSDDTIEISYVDLPDVEALIQIARSKAPKDYLDRRKDRDVEFALAEAEKEQEEKNERRKQFLKLKKEFEP